MSIRLTIGCLRPDLFDDGHDAGRIANATDYRLVAGVWTRDASRVLRLARRLRGGHVFVTNYGAGGSLELPLGDVKHSGHGREIGFEALCGFSALKTFGRSRSSTKSIANAGSRGCWPPSVRATAGAAISR